MVDAAGQMIVTPPGKAGAAARWVEVPPGQARSLIASTIATFSSKSRTQSALEGGPYLVVSALLRAAYRRVTSQRWPSRVSVTRTPRAASSSRSWSEAA